MGEEEEEGEEGVSEVVEEVQEEEGEDIHRALRSRRRKTYWIWPNTWIKRLW